MKVIILAAGYGTRLQRDIRNDPNQTYKHLLDVPKPLVPVGGECLISRWMVSLSEIRGDCEIDEVYLVTNHHYVGKFYTWAKQWPDVQILDDGSCTNESRLGAIVDLNLCIDKFQIEDDLLIIGGDTLFYQDFDLKSVLDEFQGKKLTQAAEALVTCYQCENSETKKFGILELNKENQVVGFLEKPDPKTTPSRWACPCFYILSKNACRLIPKFLEEKKDSPLKDKDATGHFIRYLYERKNVFAVPLKSGRFDIGSLQSYIECDQYYSGSCSRSISSDMS